MSLAVTGIVLTWGIPRLAMWLSGRDQPLPIPGTAMAMYTIVAIVGVLVYVAISDEALAEFVGPVKAFLRGPSPGARAAGVARALRAAGLVLVPLLAGGFVYSQTVPRSQSPTLLRIQHPTIPGAFERLKSPVREPSDDRVKTWMAEAKFTGGLEEARKAFHDQAVAEGRILFQINCRPCHGDAADGAGPMAWGFRLKPANFRDAGTIATVVEAYAFWRVTEGGPGLPPAGSPSDSAMPIWKTDLTEEQRWKTVLAAYDLADVEPRKPEKLEAGRAPYAPSALAALSGVRAAWAQAKGSGAADDIEKGKRIYEKRCLACHGEKGDGQGPVADFLDPRPRDFVLAAYKFRTTLSGEAPTDEDLFRVVTNGITGTAMSGWTILSEAERRQVITYIKAFSPEAFASPPEKVKVARADVASSAELISQGKEVYRKAKCWECHGDEGRGEGDKAGDLKDDAGLRIRPANLTKGWRIKGGREARDIFLRFTTGVDGTPMPSFADALSEDERWALAHYVRALQTDEEPGTGVVLRAVRVKGDLPGDAADPRWRDAPVLAAPLAGQVLAKPRWQNHSVDAVAVRAMYNDQAVAFLLEWDDPVKDTVHAPGPDPDLKDVTYPRIDLSTKPAEKLRDAIRLQFPVTIPAGPDRPHFFLGTSGRPVTLWHWKADLDEDPSRKTAVEEEVAEGFQRPITVQHPEAQGVVGKGSWDKGRWRVVLSRSLAGKDKDITFTRGTLIPFAVHAWDGSNGEKGLMMSLSSWNFVILEVPTPLSVYLSSFLGFLAVVLAEWGLIRRSRRGSGGDAWPPSLGGPGGGEAPAAAPRPLGDASARATMPTASLREDHTAILRGLDVLEGLGLALAAGKPADRTALASLTDFFVTFVDRFHHEKEEQHLFPALERHGLPREGGPTGAMRHEHEEGRALVRVMAHGSDREVAEGIELYAVLLRTHIDKENGIVFPLAEQLLPEEEQRALGRAFEAAEQAAGGPGFRERWLRELARLEAAGAREVGRADR